MGPPMNKRSRKRGNDEAEANTPPKVLRKDHAAFRPAQSTLGGKSLASMVLEAGSTFFTPATQETPTDAKSVSDPEPLSYAEPQPNPKQDIFQEDGPQDPYRKCCYRGGARVALHRKSGVKEIDLRPIRGRVARRYLPAGVGRDQQMPPGYPGRMPRHGRSHSATGVTEESQSPDSQRDQKIQVREEEIKKLDQEIKSLRTVETKVHGLRNQAKNLETLLEAEVNMKKAAKAKNVGLAKELESLRTSSRIFKLATISCPSKQLRQVFVDAVSAGIAKGMSEGLKHGIEHGKANLDLSAIKAYDPVADTKYVAALHALKDLKYPLVDQLEKLKDAPVDLIMASLYLESDSGEDAPQWILELRPSSSQLKVPVYPEKKKCRVVCRTHGVGSAHHARFDGVPVSVPTVAPQGLAILLADAAT
ncbi:hypothetical protein Tco_0281496 [Tanacetum coccineum]